uniref:Uncharacterized protein n=1 Tax=Candidatus Methanogaster sp. ANME-2c ERB4 TaxID=2759911 RepID=A0A7G9Y9L5_9EURY|nr:hypothetical protein MHIOGHHE_00003 [Methanosarcinales archaeon ANME-2c ERB4]QNO46277.1 hypothetical protein KJEMPLHC_00003 [Methanosarcinales archaeon ANME-2c ERB4]
MWYHIGGGVREFCPKANDDETFMQSQATEDKI